MFDALFEHDSFAAHNPVSHHHAGAWSTPSPATAWTPKPPSSTSSTSRSADAPPRSTTAERTADRHPRAVREVLPQGVPEAVRQPRASSTPRSRSSTSSSAPPTTSAARSSATASPTKASTSSTRSPAPAPSSSGCCESGHHPARGPRPQVRQRAVGQRDHAARLLHRLRQHRNHLPGHRQAAARRRGAVRPVPRRHPHRHLPDHRGRRPRRHQPHPGQQRPHRSPARRTDQGDRRQPALLRRPGLGQRRQREPEVPDAWTRASPRPTPPGRLRRTRTASTTPTSEPSAGPPTASANKASSRFVSNNGWVDGNTADGIRKTFADEFSDIWVYNLRGNQRTAGELSRQEGGKVFGSGARTGVAVLVAAKREQAHGHLRAPLLRCRRLPDPRGEARRHRRRQPASTFRGRPSRPTTQATG